MSRKVFISSDMSVDERIYEVSIVDPQAALIWPWILTTFDDWGRAIANPMRIKASTFPSITTVTPELISEALTLYAQAGLVIPYEVCGKQYMYIQPDKWFKWQSHIPGFKRVTDKSRIPAPPVDDNAQLSANARDCTDSSANALDSTPSPTPSPSPTPTGTKNICAPDGADLPQPPEPGERPEEPVGSVKPTDSEQYTPEFEQFWASYPRPVNKTKAYRQWQARLRSKRFTPADMTAAAQNYAQSCDVNNTETKFILHPATFLSRDLIFREWIAVPPAPPGPPAESKVGQPVEKTREYLDHFEKLDRTPPEQARGHLQSMKQIITGMGLPAGVDTG
jgi:hypothetical protein